MTKKYKIEIEETLKFNHVITVNVEDGADLDKALDDLESKGYHPDDIYDIDDDNSIKILDVNKDESGECSFEVVDVKNI